MPTKKKKNERKKQNKSNVREKQKQLNFKSFFFSWSHTHLFFLSHAVQASMCICVVCSAAVAPKVTYICFFQRNCSEKTTNDYSIITYICETIINLIQFAFMLYRSPDDAHTVCASVFSACAILADSRATAVLFFSH